MRDDERPPVAFDVEPRRISRAQWTLAAIIVALAAGGVAYRLLVNHKLEQTSALFIGIPSLVALVLALTPRAKSIMGIVMKGVTLALLLSAPLLGEGFVCILMAAPIFYLVAFIVAFVIKRVRSNPDLGPGGMLGLTLLPLLVMSFEGTHPSLSFPRAETVTAVRRVAARPEDVEQALAARPRFNAALPPYLRLGFPRPVDARGTGLDVGDTRVVRFAGGEGHPGDLTLRVSERTPGRVVFRAVEDGSKVAHWLAWRASEVEFREVSPGETEVRWTIRYDRLLDPAWYFGPWERYATRRAAAYLIETVATPAAGGR
jgi:hypothetical protein